MTDTTAIKYCWEDLPVGTVIELGSFGVDRDEVIDFASKYDPQPFHLSDEAAAQSMFGRLAASGWHTCAMVMGLMTRNFLLQSSSLGSPGMEKGRENCPEGGERCTACFALRLGQTAEAAAAL